jgi:hypothetical protein
VIRFTRGGNGSCFARRVSFRPPLQVFGKGLDAADQLVGVEVKTRLSRSHPEASLPAGGGAKGDQGFATSRRSDRFTARLV